MNPRRPIAFRFPGLIRVNRGVGFFPADAPELCISVVLDEPKNGHYGGQTAAPIFKNIAEQAAKYLNIRPDHLDPDAESMAVIIDANSPSKTLTQRAP